MRFSIRVAASPQRPSTRSIAPRWSRPQMTAFGAIAFGRKRRIGVERRRAERRHGAAVREQAGQPAFADGRERLRRIGVAAGLGRRDAAKSVGAALGVDERLMQMPAAGHRVRKRRQADEAGVKALAAQGLAHAIAKRHHLVGRGQRIGGIEHRFHLARAELDLERGERQAEAFGGALDDAQGLVGHVGAAFAEQLVAGVNEAHLGRLARPGGALRIERRVAVARGESIDVELDLEAALQAEAGCAEAIERAAQDAPRVDGHRRRARRTMLRHASSRCAVPRAGRESSPGRAAAAGCWRSRSRATRRRGRARRRGRRCGRRCP